MRRALALAACAVALAACGGKRSDTEHRMLQWAQALNTHLATDAEGGNSYPRELAEVDPMLRLGLTFEDAWGNALHYRRVHDGKYDLASPGPDGEIGSDDDVIVSNAMIYKPEKIYPTRPASGLTLQRDEAPGSTADIAESEADADDYGYGDD
jgi:hypothetical protein